MTAKFTDYPDNPCPKCEFSQQWVIKQTTNQANKTIYQYVCGHCDYRYRQAKKEIVKRLRLEPEYIEPRNPRNLCAVCGAIGAENHHWAPIGLFGEEAEKWPQSFLCRPCHERWHKTVTPKLMP